MKQRKVEKMDRRRMLQRASWIGGAALAGVGNWGLPPRLAHAADNPIKIGMPVDLSGALSSTGTSAYNTVKMAVDQLNQKGGLLGRPVEVLVEDTATNETVGVGMARKLVQRDKVDVVIGGVSSAMRNAIKDVIVTRSKTLYIYPFIYEGRECMQGLFCTGPTPTQLCDRLIPWLVKSGKKRFAVPGTSYVFSQMTTEYVKPLIEKHGGELVYQEYFPRDQVDFSVAVARIMANKADVVFNLVINPGMGPLFKHLNEAGFQKGGGRLASIFHDDRYLALSQPEEVEGMVSCYDYFRAGNQFDPGSARLQAEYDKRYGGLENRTAGALYPGAYRAVEMWATAVREAGTTERQAVAKALDHAKVAVAPGGPAEMVPGQQHCRLNAYVAEAKNGRFSLLDRGNQLVEPRQC